VARAAVVAGGGDDPGIIREAIQHNCDVYLTGEWYFRQRPSDAAVRQRFEAVNRDVFELASTSRMLLVAVSHAASEYLVMTTQMSRVFQDIGLNVSCIPQEDWWR
jgi:hypothetical protein